MVPIPEGVERDEEEPKEGDMSDDTSTSTASDTASVDLKEKRRWVHKSQAELEMID